MARLTDPARQRVARGWTRVDHRTRWTPGFVYVVRSDANGDVKIGFSRNVSIRVDELRRAHARTITLLLVLGGGERLERALYVRFENQRIRGEWFYSGGDLADWIAAVQFHVGPPRGAR